MRSSACAVVAYLATLGVAVAIDSDDRRGAGECATEGAVGDGTFFPEEQQIVKDSEDGADFFEVIYGTTFKVAISKKTEEQYILTQCGLEIPTTEEVDKVAPLPSDGTWTRKNFFVPVQNYAVTSTVISAFLDALAVDDRASYLPSESVHPCWRKALDCGAKLESAYGGNQTLREEQLASVEVAFTDSFDTSVKSLLNHVAVPVSQDPSPLGSAEYVKYLGAFFNKDPESNRIYDSVKTGYDDAGKAYSSKPVVAWISYSSYFGEVFYVYKTPYKMLYVEQSHGENFDAATALVGLVGLSEQDNHFEIDIGAYADRQSAADALFAKFEDVDVVIDETYAPNPLGYDWETFLSTFGLTNESTLKFVQNPMAIRHDGKLSVGEGGMYHLDWFESRLSRPDWAVEGLARVIHNDVDRETFFFRNIGLGEEPELYRADECSATLPVCGEGEPAVIPSLGDGTSSGRDDTLWYLLFAAVVVAVLLGFAVANMMGKAEEPEGLGNDVQFVEEPKAGEA